jgi:predicted flavoprotein YhiN
VSKKSPFDPKPFVGKLVLASGFEIETKWADLSKTHCKTNLTFSSEWKSTFKEEFVTAGGINLKEVNFKTMESKLHETCILEKL